LESIVRYKHGTKSYVIVRRLLGYIYAGRPLNVVDLTYGVGRFYRLSRPMIGRIIAVDIEKHRWEIEPTVFYQMDCRVFVSKVLNKEIELGDVDLVVVDPPWSSEKRGVKPREAGISSLPYHMKGVNSQSIIQAALRLAGVLGKPLLYRYKEPLECKHLVRAVAEVKMMYNTGYIYYGVCEARSCI
jgi:predicted RNA methylase